MICRRCGREQPSLHSPCPVCGREAGSASFIPTATPLNTGTEAIVDPRRWGGEAEPQSMTRELMLVFARAHRGWAARYQPHLLESWLA